MHSIFLTYNILPASQISVTFSAFQVIKKLPKKFSLPFSNSEHPGGSASWNDNQTPHGKGEVFL
jgi:hypothetical protein